MDGQDLLHISVLPGQESVYSNLQLCQQSVDLGSSRDFSLDLAGKASARVCVSLLACSVCTVYAKPDQCCRLYIAHLKQ